MKINNPILLDLSVPIKITNSEQLDEILPRLKTTSKKLKIDLEIIDLIDLRPKVIFPIYIGIDVTCGISTITWYHNIETFDLVYE